MKLDWPTAFTYFWMVAAWVFGVAVAIKTSTVMFAVLAGLVPPVAWIFAARWLIDRFAF